jgi:hypothetical protein
MYIVKQWQELEGKWQILNPLVHSAVELNLPEGGLSWRAWSREIVKKTWRHTMTRGEPYDDRGWPGVNL